MLKILGCILLSLPEFYLHAFAIRQYWRWFAEDYAPVPTLPICLGLSFLLRLLRPVQVKTPEPFTPEWNKWAVERTVGFYVAWTMYMCGGYVLWLMK